MNIRELAAHCQLSISSVSRALNNPVETAQMSRKTYDYVHAMARQLGYRPNYHARAFHKKCSNCIGFIGSSSLNSLGITLLEGISDVLNSREMTTYISSTRDDIGRETKAFDKMFYRSVDAVIHLPIIQQGEYRTDHLSRLLDDNPGHPPVLSLLSGSAAPGMFELRMKDAEAGRKAALRQLQLGCRKFGIVSTCYRSPAEDDGIEAYRNTLLENGIPQQQIIEAAIWHTFPAEKRQLLHDIDGAWIAYYLLIPTCHHALGHVLDPKKLHVDTISGSESRELLFWLQMGAGEASRIDDYFASLNVFQYSSYQIGVHAGEMVIDIIDNPSRKPYTRELEWMTP